MALKALKCPNCDANIQIDDARDYGFCSYCGSQVQIREVMEIRYSQKADSGIDMEYSKKLEAGKAFHKIGDYYKAEMVYMEMLREYPGKAEIYEGLVCTITRDYTLFLVENIERVTKLMNKMVLVAGEVEKPYYLELQERVLGLFGEGMLNQQKEENRAQIAEQDKMIREHTILLAVSFLFALGMFVLGKGDFLLSRIGFCACVVGVVSMLVFLASSLKKNSLLKRQEELEDSIL